jgi:hypothetical protein
MFSDGWGGIFQGVISIGRLPKAKWHDESWSVPQFSRKWNSPEFFMKTPPKNISLFTNKEFGMSQFFFREF